MFKLEPKPTFAATVNVTVPGGDSQPLAVVFRHKTKSEIAKWQTVPQDDLDMALDIVESVADKPEGQSLRDFLAKVFDAYPAAALDVYLTYLRELTQSRVKN